MRKVQADTGEAEGCDDVLGGVVAFPVLRVPGCSGEQSCWPRQTRGRRCTHSSPALPQHSNLLQNAFGEP